MKYSAIIVDDEPKASLVLKNLIEELEKGITIIDLINEPKKAKSIIQKKKPDFLFLDIDMPFLNGFDILESLDNPDFEIIFVTGHDEFAINAFKFSATGYILKPIDIDDLEKTIDQSIVRLDLKKSKDQNNILIQNINNNQHKKIGIPTLEGLDFMSIADIVRCEGVMKCTKVFSENHKPLISSYNIGEFVKLLSPYEFFSVHKSHLINLNKIKKYYKDGSIIMSDDSIIPLARRKKQDFLSRITKVN